MSEPRRAWWSVRRPSGLLVWTSGFLLFAGFLVPLINANRFRRQIQTALEQALGRRVEIGAVTLRLLPAPGFQMDHVVVGEDPAFGLEHFAYMTSMQARLRLRTLWTGQVQLASLILEEPSINLVKNAHGRWNFENLMQRLTAGARGYSPYIGIDEGRVNFKFEEDKSVFHLQEVEAAVSPPRDAGGRWWIRFAARPARTDQVLGGMGRLRGQGSVVPAPFPAVNLELTLEESPLSHLLRLAQGRDHGIHGTVGARLRLSGEPAHVRLDGVVRVGDFHRWDLFPNQERRVDLPVSGHWDLDGRRLVVETASAAAGGWRLRFELSDYLGRPRWRATAAIQGLNASPWIEVARHFGAELPAGLELRGTVDGEISWADSGWPAGSIHVRDIRLTLPGRSPIEMDLAELSLEEGRILLAPGLVRLGAQPLELSGAVRVAPLRLEAQFISRGVSIEGVPFLPFAWFSAGQWTGRAAYLKEGALAGAWSGGGVLRDARWRPPGLESPVEVAHARVRWDAKGTQIDQLEGSVGDALFTGSCRTNPAGATCRLRAEELSVSQLDRWLRPGQRASRWAAWKQALGLDRPQAGAWLKTTRVDGTVQVGRLHLSRWTFHNLRAAIAWNDGVLLLSGLRADLGKGSLTADVRADFSSGRPVYTLQATARAVDLRSLAEAGALPSNFQRGLADGKVQLTAAGRTAAELRAALKVDGAFAGRSITLHDVQAEADEDGDRVLEIRSLDGRFQWTRNGLRLSDLRMTLGKEVFEGSGSLGGSRPVALEMASGGRRWRLFSIPAADQAPVAP